MVFFTTVPISDLRLSSLMLNENRLGSGGTISKSSSLSISKPSIEGCPPVVTRTLFAFISPFDVTIKYPSSDGLISSTRVLVINLTPYLFSCPTRLFTTSIASCDCGNTHWSSCVTNLIPLFSNHWHVSSFEK